MELAKASDPISISTSYIKHPGGWKNDDRVLSFYSDGLYIHMYINIKSRERGRERKQEKGRERGRVVGKEREREHISQG